MTAELVNLRRERKRRARDAAGVQAAAKRAQFGRRAADVSLVEAEKTLAERRIDGHRLGARHAGPEPSDDA